MLSDDVLDRKPTPDMDVDLNLVVPVDPKPKAPSSSFVSRALTRKCKQNCRKIKHREMLGAFFWFWAYGGVRSEVGGGF